MSAAGTEVGVEESAGAVRAPLADRANNEPSILRGLSSTETVLAALVAFPVWAVVGAAVAIPTGIWAAGVLIAAVGPMVTVWMLAGYLATIKRDRPDGYYLHLFKRWRDRVGLGVSPFISHYGYWEIGRSLPARPAKRRARKP